MALGMDCWQQASSIQMWWRLCADLIGSLKMNAFIKAFPDRFVQTGIAEANMMGIAAGLATAGKIPYTGTFANFSTGRVYDQIRQSIAYSDKNVKICASHAGLTLGEDGATHQILEDIGLMKMLPGMTVINPCDYNQTKAATIAIAEHHGPVYLRFGRPSWPIFIPESMPFVIGKGILMQEGTDVTIIATGHLVAYAMEAVQKLKEQGISAELINIHTIKPLDEEIILDSSFQNEDVLLLLKNISAMEVLVILLLNSWPEKILLLRNMLRSMIVSVKVEHQNSCC